MCGDVNDEQIPQDLIEDGCRRVRGIGTARMAGELDFDLQPTRDGAPGSPWHSRLLSPTRSAVYCLQKRERFPRRDIDEVRDGRSVRDAVTCVSNGASPGSPVYEGRPAELSRYPK